MAYKIQTPGNYPEDSIHSYILHVRPDDRPRTTVWKSTPWPSRLARLGIASQTPESPLNARSSSSEIIFTERESFDSLGCARMVFSSLQRRDRLWCAPIFPMGIGAVGVGVKRPLREHHSPPSSAQDKNERNYTSNPARLQSVDSVNFTVRHLKISCSCYVVVKTYDNPSRWTAGIGGRTRIAQSA